MALGAISPYSFVPNIFFNPAGLDEQHKDFPGLRTLRFKMNQGVENFVNMAGNKVKVED